MAIRVVSQCRILKKVREYALEADDILKHLCCRPSEQWYQPLAVDISLPQLVSFFLAANSLPYGARLQGVGTRSM